MPTCATCGRPVDAEPAEKACPSCTWRAAVRASKIAVSGGSSAPQADTSSAAADETDGPLLDTSLDAAELTARLCGLAAAAGDTLSDEQAQRVYAALVRGNQRPYRTELNRLTSRFIDRLEGAWPSDGQ